VNARGIDANLLRHLPLDQFQRETPPAYVVAQRFQLFRRARSAGELMHLRQRLALHIPLTRFRRPPS
jgi:hypothetical protein